MTGAENNPWQTLSSEVRYSNSWIEITHHDVINPSGGAGIYGTVHFKNLAIGVIPLDREGYTWLVGQYRYPLRRYSWEIPEGGGAHGIDPLESARRELKEETGIEAARWQCLIEMDLSNSVSDERAIIFLATELSMGEASPEETEALTLRRLPFDQAYEMVINGEITDSLSVAGILRLKLLLLDGGLA
jgi:8-oxo-dGTP pyrophosphatase MutT (NUDIX family)